MTTRNNKKKNYDPSPSLQNLQLWESLALYCRDAWCLKLSYAVEPILFIEDACRRGDVHLLKSLRNYRLITAKHVQQNLHQSLSCLVHGGATSALRELRTVWGMTMSYSNLFYYTKSAHRYPSMLQELSYWGSFTG
jgi:hypothetical protein